MAFCRGQLISVGQHEENALALWDTQQGLVLKSVLLHGHSTNMVIADVNEQDISQFVTIGTQNTFTYWRVCPQTGDLQFSEIQLPSDLADTDFVSACFSQRLPQPIGGALLLMGTSDGALVAYNPITFEFVGQKRFILEGQIGSIRVVNNMVTLASSTGCIVRYPIIDGDIMPPQDVSKIVQVSADGAITALAMDSLNGEGMIGTNQGNIFYVNLNEKAIIKLVSRVAATPDAITNICHDPTNNQVFLTGCGSESSDIKLYASQTVDQVMNFS